MRRFNTAGPCVPEKHYMLPALDRLPEVVALVEQESYFVLHAPRQTGKTTALRDLATQLCATGRFAAVYASCEAGQAAGDDYEAAERVVWHSLWDGAQNRLPTALRPPAVDTAAVPGAFLQRCLSAWSRACPLPLVLLLDEIDALMGQSLISVLRQLRVGFPDRPAAFPSSVILCGLRDVRDYKTASGGEPGRLGSASPFNVKVKSIRLRNFEEEEVRRLYSQHTAETGQIFEAAALARAFELSGGQPWLVNALAREVVEEIGVPVREPVTVAHLDQAVERLVLARATHLDSLAARLAEDRVRRVLEPVLAGSFGETPADVYDDDLQYVRDLGLVAQGPPVRVANAIYREVIVRVLAGSLEQRLPVPEQHSFVLPDGRLDMRRVLAEFAAFWRQHGEILAGTANWREVAAQLVLMAWLQRIVNGGGYVDREYGIGRGRIDLLVRWPHGTPRRWQREALELKVWAPGRKDPMPEGLAQLDGYLDRLGLDTGTLVVFDRRPEAEEPELRTGLAEARTPSGRTITLLRA
ncbi:MAG: ATP-binding protein [Pseudomonadota bacterium]